MSFQTDFDGDRMSMGEILLDVSWGWVVRWREVALTVYLAGTDSVGLNTWAAEHLDLYDYHADHLLKRFVYGFAPKLVSLKNASFVGAAVVGIHSYSLVSLLSESKELDSAGHRLVSRA